MKKNFLFVNVILRFIILTFFFVDFLSAQLVESFETGLPTSYSDVGSLQLASGVWTCTPNQIASNDTWAASGSLSCQLRSLSNSEIFSPVFAGGVGVLSVSARSTGATGSLQINISRDNGLTWSAMNGSPFSLSATPTNIEVPVNDLFVNKVHLKRTAGTVLVDNLNITSCTQTKLKAGDLAIVQLNETGVDRFSFVTFVELAAGTQIIFTDKSFSSTTAFKTTEGILKYTAPTTIAAGTTISWYDGMDITGTGWESNAPSSFTISGTDQLFAFQGEWANLFQLICGMNLSHWISSGDATTTTSYLPDQLTDGVNAFSFSENKKNAYYNGIKSSIKNILKQNIYSSTNWTTSTTDQGAQAINFTFENTHTVSINSSYPSFTIYAGETIIINPAVQLTVGSFVNYGTLKLLSDASGTATFIPSTISGSGTYSINQYLPAGSRNWYVSSPVQTAVVPENSRFITYCEDGSNIDLAPLGSTAYWKYLASASTFTPGKGYIYSLVSPTNSTNLEFNGNLIHTNADEVMDIAVTRTEQALCKGFNLIGNPYTSYLDWSAVKELPINADLESSVWFRTKNQSGYTFATYNCTGNQVVSNGAITSITNLIPPMQAFWVRVKQNTSATSYSTILRLNGSMRTHCSAINNRLKTQSVVENQSVRLVLSNGEATDETLLYFTPNAANEKDDYDSPKYMNQSTQTPDLYSIVDTDKLVINGMNTIPIESDIRLGFSASKKALYEIKATELQGLPAGMQLFLKDKETSALFNLTDGASYTFDSDVQSSDSRFSILFRALGSVNKLKDLFAEQTVQVYVNAEGFIQVNAVGCDKRSKVEVSNLSGGLVTMQAFNDGKVILKDFKATGVYLVKITNDRQLVVKKVVVP